MAKVKPETVLVRADHRDSLADNVAAVAKATRDLTGPGRLTEDALITLIHRKVGYKASRAQIEATLAGMRGLDEFVQPK